MALKVKTYNNVQANVTFSKASSRVEINPIDGEAATENIALTLGKISKWYEALVPTGGSSGKILAWNTAGTAKWSDPLHPSVTKSADTTSTASPAHGGTFTTVDTVTRDAYGHVTKINTKTVTLPADSNTDTKVTQSQTTTTNYRPILFGAKNSTDVSTLADTITDAAFTSTKMYAQPSTGLIYCTGRQIENVTIQTGSTKQTHITLQTLMTWLITTKTYIPSGKYCHVIISTTWAYANNDILQVNIGGTNYEIQLAGVIIEFIGSATSYNAGMFRLLIHSSPTTSFTPASGYTVFPVSTIAEYTCNGSEYSPIWKKIWNSHPTYTSKSSGLYKITVDGTGHVSAATAVAKADITALGIPGSDTNTTYTFDTGDAVGQFKVIPSGGSAANYNINGIAAGTASGTAKHLAYYSAATSITSSGNLIYSVENSTASTPRSRTILHIFNSNTVGNDATQLVGGVKGVLSYGDGGPQINFSTGATIGGAQDSSIIWTDNDGAGYGASWHFVSNQPDWTVVSKRFHARTSISVGTNVPPVVNSTTATNYPENLYVSGTSKFTDSGFGPIHIVRSGSTYAAGIKFSNSNGLIGAIGMTGNVDTALIRWKSDLSTSYTILDTGNTSVTTSGSGNAITALSFSNGTFTATKGSTFSLSTHTHNYAGSSSAGGAATSANKLNTNAGATNRPVYFSGGIPVQCDAPASGSWFKGVPLIGTDGVMEIGKIIDFHSTNTSTADYDLRLQYTGTATGKTVTLPGATGTVALLTKGSTNYWGMIDGDGGTTGWIRTTSNGLISATAVSLANGGDGALGTSSWAFKEAYIATVHGTLDGTASQAIKLRSAAARTDSTVDTADTTPYQKYWVKIASSYTTGTYIDLESLWAVNDVYGNRQGILKVRARVEGTAGTFGSTRTIRWLVADSSIDVNRFAIVCYNNRKPDGTEASGTATVELWWKSTGQYASFSFVLLDETRRTGKQPNDWVLYDTTTYGQAALPTTGNITYSVAATILNSTAGNAATATTATNANNIYVTLTNPSGEKTYYTPFFETCSSANKALLTNNGFSYVTREGTADVLGYGVVTVGNGTASGTAGNKRGFVRFYSENTYYAQVYPVALSANRNIQLPDKAGTIALTSDLTIYYSSTTSRTANTVLAAPNGSAGAATFRKLVAADLPDSYIPLTGSVNVTGNIKITKASGDTGFYAKRSDTGVEVWMGVGSGGTNHGIYSNKLGKWMMYGDATNVYLNGNAATATTATKVNVTLATTSKAYLLGTTTTPTSSATGVTPVADTGVYLGTVAGSLFASSIYGSGAESQSTAPTGGYRIYDCRSVNVSPNDGDKAVNFYFHMTDMPDTSLWWSVLHMRGWTGAYAAWEIAGPSDSKDQRTNPLYVRTSNTNTAWGSWRKIYDTSNPPTASEVGALASTTKYAGSSSVGGPATKNCINYNASSTTYAINNSTTVTVNDLASAGVSANGMVKGATDNPLGSAQWVHVWSQAWTNNANTSWVSQIALGVDDSNGMWYRTTEGTIVGAAWKRVLDSTNYTSYTVTKTGTGASGTWGISITGNAATATKASTINTESGTSDGARPVFYAYLGDNTKVVYHTEFTYNPSTTKLSVKSIDSSLVTSTYLAGNKGTTIINSTAAAGSYVMLAKMNSTNGYFTHGVYQGSYRFHYTAKSTVDANTNNVTYSTTFGENGSWSFPAAVSIAGTLTLTRAQDGSGTADSKPALIVGGDSTAAHLELDSNEIMAKATGTTTAPLYINNDGGTVYINAKLAAKFTETPTSGQVAITDGTGGNIKSSGYTIAASVPSGAKFTDTVTTATTSGSGNAVTAISASNGALTVTKGSTFSLSTHTHNYAGSSSAGGPATNVAIARVTKDSKVFPGANKVVFEEYSAGTDYNLPSNHWYHIMSAQGSDTKYGTQLALGMTTTAAYYRVYNNQTWSDWKSLINTNTDTKVNVTLGTTTKAYLLGTSTTPTSSAQAVTSIADTGVYLGTAAGSLYATTFYENGTSLANKYAAYVEITSITTVTANKKFTCTANTQTYKTFMVRFSYGSTYMTQWFTVTGTTAAYYPIFASMSTDAEAVLSVQCSVGASATITFTFSNGANMPVVEKVVGFKFGG